MNEAYLVSLFNIVWEELERDDVFCKAGPTGKTNLRVWAEEIVIILCM